MKKVFSMICLAAFAALMIVGCGSKKSPKPEIGELASFKDAATNFELKYPKNWVIANAVGESFVCYSSKEAKSEFLNLANFNSEQEIPGTKINFIIKEVTPEMTVDSIFKMKSYEPNIYSAPENVTIDGTPAIKQKYSFDFGAEFKFNGEVYYATKDSQVVNIIVIEDIGNNLDALRPKINEILASVKLGTKPAAGTPAKKDSLVQAPGPDATTKAANGNGFTVQIPTNFKMSGSGASFMISGERRGDSYMSVTIKDAKKNKLENVADAFKGSLGAYTKSSFGGAEAAVFGMKAKKDLDAKMYVVVRNNQIYQIVVSYFKPEADLYKDAMDKMAKSFKFQ